MPPQALGGYPLVDWALLLVGVFLIATALVFGPRWQNVKPIDLASEKFGTLKLPFVPLVALTGVAFVAVGVYFRWQAGQSGAAEQHQLQIKLQDLTQEFERFKNYEMKVQLDFHTSVDPVHLTANLFVLKPGDPSPRSSNQVLNPTSASNILSATVPSLGPGDTIYFVASESGPADHPRIWESEKLVIPIAQLNMSAKP